MEGMKYLTRADVSGLMELVRQYEQAMTAHVLAYNSVSEALDESLDISTRASENAKHALVQSSVASIRGFGPAREAIYGSLLNLSAEYGRLGQTLFLDYPLELIGVKSISSIELLHGADGYLVRRCFSDGEYRDESFPEVKQSRVGKVSHLGTPVSELPEGVDPLLSLLPRNATLPAEVALFVQDRFGYLRAVPDWELPRTSELPAVRWVQRGSFIKTVIWGGFEWRVYATGAVAKTGVVSYSIDRTPEVQPLPRWEVLDLSEYVLDPTAAVFAYARVLPALNSEDAEGVYSSWPSFEYSEMSP